MLIRKRGPLCQERSYLPTTGRLTPSSLWSSKRLRCQHLTWASTAVKKASIRSRCPVTVIEVFMNVLRQRGEPAALIGTTLMKQGKVIALDSELAMDAAKLGVRHKLPLADSIIFATAQKHAVVLLTPDSDFLGLENVRCISRKSTKT